MILGITALIAAAALITPLIYHHVGFGADMRARQDNIAALRMSGNIYAKFTSYVFSYPPSAILFFYPLAWISSLLPSLDSVMRIASLLSLLALAATFYAVYRHLFQRSKVVTWTAALWSSILALAWAPVIQCIGFGQIGTVIVALVVVDCLLVRQSRRGFLVGLATAIKLYPGVFIILWLWRRQWRQAFSAIGTVATMTVLSAVLWPSSSSTYYRVILFGGREITKFTTSVNARIASSAIVAPLYRYPFHPKEFHTWIY